MSKRWVRWTLPSMLVAAMTVSAMAQDEGDHSGRRRGMRDRMSRDDGAPKVGEEAPDFTLKSMDGKSETTLSDYNGKRPVMLFFGSYT